MTTNEVPTVAQARFETRENLEARLITSVSTDGFPGCTTIESGE
jgi:hypothetical protein